jgi:predicted Zn-dependent protease with MMP-like domain
MFMVLRHHGQGAGVTDSYESWDDLEPKQAAKAQAWLQPSLLEGERIEAMFSCESWRPLMSIVILTNARLVGVPVDCAGDPPRQVARASIAAVRSERRRVRRELVVEHGEGVLRFAGVSERITARLANRLAREPVGPGAPQIDPRELTARPDERMNVEMLETPWTIAVLATLLCLLWVSPAPLLLQISASVIGALVLLVSAADFWRIFRWHVGTATSSADAEFEALVNEVESAGTLDPREPDDFDVLVRQALDALPTALQKVLSGNVAVVVSDEGAERGALGLYDGDSIAFDTAQDRIIIFRDTLLDQFGHDPDRLREEVRITVLHELAHHLGADELRVRSLGLG